MKIDCIIIGGGLSAMTCGIALLRKGKSCVIISSGQNAMHFSSGSFSLLSCLPDGTPVDEPLKAIGQLPCSHPYRKIGEQRMAEYTSIAPEFFSSCGIELKGSAVRNSWRMTAAGTMKKAWLGFPDTSLFDTEYTSFGESAIVVNLLGFKDFLSSFIADRIRRSGAECKVTDIMLKSIDNLRANPTEMRSTNIARVFSDEKVLGEFIDAVNRILEGEQSVILPQVFGLEDAEQLDRLRSRINADVHFISTMIPSVPGIRTQKQLKKKFEELGGIFLMGDTVVRGEFCGSRLKAVYSSNLGSIPLSADNFILATGSFFGKGLYSSSSKIYEPLFGLDTESPENRNRWYDEDFFGKQNYLSYGVHTDDRFRVSKDSKTIENLYAIGSILDGTNALSEGCGAGTAICSAMAVSDFMTEF